MEPNNGQRQKATLQEIVERHSRYSAQYHFMLGDQKVSELYDLPANQAGNDMGDLIVMVHDLTEKLDCTTVIQPDQHAISNAMLGAMVRNILQGCPEFQVLPGQRDIMYLEISSVYTDDLAHDQMEKIRKALELIGGLHRQYIAGTDETK